MPIFLTWRSASRRRGLAAWVLMALLAPLLGGCGQINGFKLLAPEQFGLSPVGPGLYIESGADEAARARLRAAARCAEAAVVGVFGEARAQPVVHACVSESCYAAFGGMGSRAKAYGHRILLSPRGFNGQFLAHEWSHAEMFTRLDRAAWLNLPRWFDEGLAVAVSQAPEHSEAHWRRLIDAGVARPSATELRALRSSRAWLHAVHRYGETENVRRRARGEAEVRPVYAAAGHEVRGWLAGAGPAGLLGLIAALNDGQDFDALFQPPDPGMADAWTRPSMPAGCAFEAATS